MRNRSSLQTLAAPVTLAALLCACGGDAKAPPTSPTQKEGEKTAEASANPAEPAAQAPPAEKVKVVEGRAPGDDDRYSLAIETARATVGAESQVTVKVIPKEPWHMNLQFPTSLKLEAPAEMALANADFKKEDAAALTEQTCQFDVKFTPAKAGEQTMTGKFKFAVCQDDECAPVTKDVEIKVAVK